MKIAVLIPSLEYRAYAGARIRYGRIAPVLAESGVELVLHDIAAFDPLSSTADVLLISKCHDSRALLAAALLGERGALVGVDLFDDYFSQSEDGRLARFRNWLRQLLAMCDFATCSTDTMAAVVGKYRADLPVHVMNDPAAPWDEAGLQETLTRKRAEVLASRRMSLAWFGVGDNPNFPIGLYDLAAYASALTQLARAGFHVQLRILTNNRAITAMGLAQIAQLPVSCEVVEWSEAGERASLAEAFAAFLPVNEQPFSRAKSLNRAVTALTAGCQVLSPGYPLYAKLGDLIYRDGAMLHDDLLSGPLKLSSERIERFRSLIKDYASAETEASHLSNFLKSVKAAPRANGMLALVHGVATNGAAHKLVRAADGISVASPYCNTPLGFDVIFRGSGDRLAMWISDKARSRLTENAAVEFGAARLFEGKKFVEVQVSGATDKAREHGFDWIEAGLPFQLATYAPVMKEIEASLVRTFGDCRVIVSEASALPLTPAA